MFAGYFSTIPTVIALFYTPSVLVSTYQKKLVCHLLKAFHASVVLYIFSCFPLCKTVVGGASAERFGLRNLDVRVFVGFLLACTGGWGK